MFTRAVTLFALCVAPLALAQDAADLQRAREEAIEQRARSVDKEMKAVDGEFDLQDLFTIRPDEHGWIKLTPTLPANLGPANRLKLRGFANPVRLDILDRDEKGVITEMRLVVANFNHANAVVVESQVHWSPEVMVIDQMTRFLTGQNYVALIQQDTTPDDKKLPRGISLRVMLGDIPGQSASEMFEAADFKELRERNWAVVEQYLRPVLSELKLTSILSVDPKLAWQVFASEWEPDPKTVQQLKELLPALNAENFKDRRDATQKLKDLGEAVVPAILRLDRKGLSPEQNSALDATLASLLKPKDELTRLRNDPNFLADCLYSSDAQILHAALNHINKLLNKDAKIDPSATTDKRALIVEPLRRELTQKLIDQTTTPIP